MSVKERDKYTGYQTTGHEWNGITELNTRVPRFLLFCLTVTFLYSVVHWLMMPAWPSKENYTRGSLGLDQRNIVEQDLKLATARQTLWSDRLLSMPIDEVLSDTELNNIVKQSGPALFSDNCAMCHGQEGQGAHSFPRLNDENWLWGGTPADIHKTLQVGINAKTAGTRVAQMPAFGSSNLLDSESLTNVSLYIQSLSNKSIGNGSRADEITAIRKGQGVFAQQCAACHGADATGNTALGAPNLSDDYWIYGADPQSIMSTLKDGRGGYMPAWSDRLTAVQLRILSLYVSDLASESTNANEDGARQ